MRYVLEGKRVQKHVCRLQGCDKPLKRRSAADIEEEIFQSNPTFTAAEKAGQPVCPGFENYMKSVVDDASMDEQRRAFNQDANNWVALERKRERENEGWNFFFVNFLLRVFVFQKI